MHGEAWGRAVVIACRCKTQVGVGRQGQTGRFTDRSTNIKPMGTVNGILPAALRARVGCVTGDDDAAQRVAGINVSKHGGEQGRCGAAVVDGRVFCDGRHGDVCRQRGVVVDGRNTDQHLYRGGRVGTIGIQRLNREGIQATVGIAGRRPIGIERTADMVVGACRPVGGGACRCPYLERAGAHSVDHIAGDTGVIGLIAMGIEVGEADLDLGVFGYRLHGCVECSECGCGIAGRDLADGSVQRRSVGSEDGGVRKTNRLPGHHVADVETDADGVIAVANTGTRQVG